MKILCLSCAISLLSACGGGGSTLGDISSSTAPSTPPSTPATWSMSVVARYAGGSNWNAYVKASDTSTTCAGNETGVAACLHGGDKRKIVSNESSCTGSSASDNLGAFEWYCVVESGKAVFYSFLKPYKRVYDLISGTSWRTVNVTLNTPTASYSSGAQVWWTNPIVSLPNNSGACSVGPYNTCDASDMARLNAANTVYLLTADQSSKGYNLDADGIALVVAPTAHLNFTNPGLNCNWSTGENSAANFKCLTHSTGQKFLWLEGNFQNTTGGAGNEAISFVSTNFSVVRNVRIGNFDNTMMDIDISNSNVFQNISGAGGTLGLYWGNVSNYNVVQGITTSSAVAVNIPNGAQNYATLVTGAVGSSAAVSLGGALSSSNIAHNVAAVGTVNGVTIAGGTQSTFSQVAAAHGTTAGVNVSVAAVKFTGNLVLGNNTSNCVGGVGLGITGACANDSLSNANISTTLNATTAFVGAVGADSSNSSVPTGSAVANTIADWTNFDNPFRILGWQGGTWGQTTSCTGVNTCQIYDFSVATAATVLRNMSDTGTTSNGAAFSVGGACPSVASGNNTLSNYSGSIVYLKTAVEIIGDGRGNDNGLCESNENCLYTPNFGAYQGHGTWGTCSFVDGTISGVNLYGYPSNGR